MLRCSSLEGVTMNWSKCHKGLILPCSQRKLLTRLSLPLKDNEAWLSKHFNWTVHIFITRKLKSGAQDTKSWLLVKALDRFLVWNPRHYLLTIIWVPSQLFEGSLQWHPWLDEPALKKSQKASGSIKMPPAIFYSPLLKLNFSRVVDCHEHAFKTFQ